MITQQNYDTTLISAGLGAAAGATLGINAGIKKAAPILAQAKDVYVNSRANEALEKLISANTPGKQVKKIIAKVTKKAGEDFPKMCSKQIKELSAKAGDLLKKAKNTKIKWVAAGVAAGTAAGILFDKLMSVKKTDKTEQ